MGLKSFLQDQGFIAKDDPAKEAPKPTDTVQAPKPMSPVIFSTQDAGSNAQQPVFVQDLPVAAQQPVAESIDPAFIKFYEDEIAKVNQPGPDYYEFRQQMITMNQRMSGKGVSSEVILQAVLTSFEAQGVSAAKLAQAADFYKAALNDKKASFLQGASAEKDHQLQKRNAALQQHQANIDGCNKKLQELQQQIRQVEENLAKERTQMEIDKTMGKEGIEKIERAESQINLAHTFMTRAIDRDIQQLQSAG